MNETDKMIERGTWEQNRRYMVSVLIRCLHHRIVSPTNSLKDQPTHAGI